MAFPENDTILNVTSLQPIQIKTMKYSWIWGSSHAPVDAYLILASYLIGFKRRFIPGKVTGGAEPHCPSAPTVILAAGVRLKDGGLGMG